MIRYALTLLLLTKCLCAQSEVFLFHADPAYLSAVKALKASAQFNLQHYEQTSPRALSDILLLQNLFPEARFHPEKNNLEHSLNNLISGKVLIYAETFSAIDIPKSNNFVSSSVIHNKTQNHIGIFTSKDNIRAQQLASAGQFYELTAITNSDWRSDRLLLSELPFKALKNASSSAYILKSIRHQKADVFLWSFSEHEDLGFRRHNHHYIPAAAVKLQFPHHRHYLISQTHPDGQRFYQLLERRLTAFKSSGQLEAFYRQLGVINPRVEDWPCISGSCK